MPAVIFLGILGLFALKKRQADETDLKCVVGRENITDVIIRAGKVYLFIMALIFLGEGFSPLILGYVVLIPPEALYWVNMVSAVLDNATLAAAEISPALSSVRSPAPSWHCSSRGDAHPGKHSQYHRRHKNGDHKPGVGTAWRPLGSLPNGDILRSPLHSLPPGFCVTSDTTLSRP